MHTGGFSLEGSEDEFVLTKNVYAQPVDLFERVVKQTNEITRSSQRVCFVIQQCMEL